jgi:transcriptional regulator with XRE-family HTH domain
VARKRASIGNAVKALRLEADLSINALARLARLDPATLSRIESEDRTLVRFVTIAQVAEALGVTLDDIAVRAGLIQGKKR